MKLYESNKLHYNKYLYKLVISNQCANYFRTEFQKDGQLSFARQKLDQLSREFDSKKTYIEIPFGTRFFDRIPVEHYYDAIEIYRYLKNKKSYQVRVETHTLILYSNDRKFLITLGNKLRHPYIELHEPNIENIELLTKHKNVIIVKSTPEYEFKITLGRKKGSRSLAKWIESNPKLAKMGDIALYACSEESYVKGYYFFVRDAKTLLIAQMMVGDNIQRIDRMVFPDK